MRKIFHSLPKAMNGKTLEFFETAFVKFKEKTLVTQNQQLVFTSGKTVSTQAVLHGFSVAVDELLA
jgi:restriction endonuclease Mrr